MADEQGVRGEKPTHARDPRGEEAMSDKKPWGLSGNVRILPESDKSLETLAREWLPTGGAMNLFGKLFCKIWLHARWNRRVKEPWGTYDVHRCERCGSEKWREHKTSFWDTLH
jgi:hypothetical protein